MSKYRVCELCKVEKGVQGFDRGATICKQCVKARDSEPVCDVACPDWVVPEVREIWNALAPDVERNGRLREGNAYQFAFVCENIRRYMDALQEVRRAKEDKSLVYLGENGYYCTNPWEGICVTRGKEVRSDAREWGMTPKALNELLDSFEPQHDDEDAAFEKLLNN